MDTPFEYVFPAIRGVMARREYYVSMCPMRLIPKIFLFNEEELVPELRAQRILNKVRVPEIARYILQNRDDYVFSAITASVDGKVRFSSLGSGGHESRVGLLHIPMESRFVINDGQHRRAAIEHAMRENPDIADESIAVVFFLDQGLGRCQQMFADLNRHAVRPSTSIGVLYDQRDDEGRLTKLSVLKLPLFKDLTEMERSTLSPRSRKLFTLSALYSATSALVARRDGLAPEELRDEVKEYWDEVSKQFPEWQQVHARQVGAAAVRRDLLHSHGIILQALGRVGNNLLRDQPNTWRKSLKKLRQIDWSRSNAKQWEGRALVGGKVSKSTTNVQLATNLIKQHLGLSLTPEEQRIEDAYVRGDHGNDRDNQAQGVGVRRARTQANRRGAS
ncbi:MAG: DNA sulfur modification protein DndB [Fimbriimonadaceae bacterium]|nr:DNA sulfur modification protein DndB [Fimbriimonadaceae bacterium]